MKLMQIGQDICSELAGCTVARLTGARIMKIATRSQYAPPSLDFGQSQLFGLEAMFHRGTSLLSHVVVVVVA